MTKPLDELAKDVERMRATVRGSDGKYIERTLLAAYDAMKLDRDAERKRRVELEDSYYHLRGYTEGAIERAVSLAQGVAKDVKEMLRNTEGSKR